MRQSMHSNMALCAVSLTVLLCAFNQTNGFGGNNGTICPQPGGPDLIIGDISTLPANYAAEEISTQTFDAFAFGRTNCNIGDQNLNFFLFPSNQHPAYTQGLFKLKDGRIEQIGMSWVSHGFTALAGNICGCGCTNPGSGSLLGAGCSDPSTASRQGVQSSLGPRFEINAYTGAFPTGSPSSPPFSGSTARRLRVNAEDLEPSSPSVQFFVEINAVSAHDSSVGNQFNNASHRPVTVTGGPKDFSLTPTGTIRRERAAIRAWKLADPAVTETDVQIPGEGMLILAAKATDLGNGTWHYEYALENQNSDISANSFSVPVPISAMITNIGFHDVSYHSGDGIPLPDGPDPDTQPDWRNFDGTDWELIPPTEPAIVWTTNSFANDPNANALRWATLYNFRFDADRPPATGQVTIGTFKDAGSVDAMMIVPEPLLCVADIAGGNGEVDVDDLLAVINAWGPCADPKDCPADIIADGEVNVDDLLAVINGWGPCS